MRAPDFVHLHVHTEDSLSRGMLTPSQVVRAAAGLGMPAVALTDHAMLSSAVEFELITRSSGVRPIFGAEIAVETGGPPGHLVLLAETEDGWRNLVRITSRAHLRADGRGPVVDRTYLGDHGAGLIALSGCLEGEVARALALGYAAEAELAAREYRAIFGSEGFFLELQDDGLEAQPRVNRGLVELGKRLGIPTVATANCRYLGEDDAGPFLVKARIHGAGASPVPGHGRYDFRTQREMGELFAGLPDALANTIVIAERCRVRFAAGGIDEPVPPALLGCVPSEHLSRLASEGLEGLVAGQPPEARVVYEERLARELQLIGKTGLTASFLLGREIVRTARAEGVAVGPGRGALPNSLVARCLGMTEIDPVAHGLVFERFLHEGQASRRTMFLFDFDVAGRERLLARLREWSSVVPMADFERMEGRLLLLDVAEALEVPRSVIRPLADLAGEPHDGGRAPGLARLAENPSAAAILERDPVLARVHAIATALDGRKKRLRAEGETFVLGNPAIPDRLPLCRDGAGGELLVPWDRWDLEAAGYRYWVFGAMPLLSVMKRAVSAVPEAITGEGGRTDLQAIPLDDPAAYCLLAAGDLEGVDPHAMQGEDGMARCARDLQPASLGDVAALYALCRPGPLAHGVVAEYLRHSAQSPRRGPTRIVESALRQTRGMPIFQEDVIRVLADFAGVTREEGENLRVMLVRGRRGSEADLVRQGYVEHAARSGIDRREAQRVLEWAAEHAGWAFMKSHALGYAMLVVRAACLKARHRKEYLASMAASRIRGDWDERHASSE